MAVYPVSNNPETKSASGRFGTHANIVVARFCADVHHSAPLKNTSIQQMSAKQVYMCLLLYYLKR